MRMHRQPNLGPIALALLVMVWLGACTDTVYRDRPPFNPPPDAASGFLGYFTASEKQTTCGNCHVDHQGDWANHDHSGAFEAVTSVNGSSTCFSCHAVSQFGNAVDTAAGWNKVQSAAYHDVQCESCHGPGETHVTTPDGNTSPLARITADTGILKNGTCGECHDSQHVPFVTQWRESRHGRANPDVLDNAILKPATYTSCLACHEARGVLKAWGVTSNFAEKNDVLTHTNALGITCAVCHNPHGSDNPGELRFPVGDPAIDNNLCMKCHARRFEPQLTSSRGPHAPQGPMFLGTAGWFPVGVDTTAQASTHGDPNANPRLCAGCHVKSITITDPVGNFPVPSVLHLFRPIPCLDPVSGQPVADNSCAYDAPSRDWSGCVASGCHSTTGAAIAAFDANRSVLAVFADQIWVDVDANGSVDSTDTGLLALVVATDTINQFSTTDSVLTVAEGALFNARLIGEGRYDNGDKSLGVHNPFLAQKLLAVTITALKAQYTYLPAPPANVQSLIQRAVARAADAGHSALSSR